MFARDSDDLLVLEGNAAQTLSQLGRHQEATEVYIRDIAVRERSPLYGPSDNTTWRSRVSLGMTFVSMGKFSEAIPLLRDSLAAYDGMGLGPDHPLLGIIPPKYGRALLGAGRPAEAVPMLQRSIAFRERKYGTFHFEIPFDLIELAKAYGQMGRGFG